MTTLRKTALLIAAIAVVSAACGTTEDETTTTAGAAPETTTTAGAAPETTTTAGTEPLTGSVAISGSSTVEPVSALNAEAFRGIHPAVGISVEGPGTGDGFRKFCAGETDVTGASRAIKDKEVDLCKEGGVEFVELKFAVDGLSVLTSRDNADVTCLTFPDLYALLGPESTGFETWNAANALAGELDGANPPYMNKSLIVTAPGEESGTYDSFVELVLEDIAEERGQEVAARLDYTASANDNIIIEGIAGSDSSLGWVGYAFYLANQDRVKAIEIDGGDGCVAPTPETIASGEYPIARPLFIYVNVAKAAANPAVAAYIDFYLSDEGLKGVDQAGYVRLDSYDELRAIWENRETGKRG